MAQMNLYIKQKQTHIENKLVVDGREGREGRDGLGFGDTNYYIYIYRYRMDKQDHSM